jgi:hypothetical protein
MSAYKKLNKQDAYITTHTAHKTWVVDVEDFSKYGIETHIATGSYLRSLQQLYYPSKLQGEIISHSYDYYNQTTLHFSESRNLNTGSFILSIPRDMYGVNIQPGLQIRLGGDSNLLYVDIAYWDSGYTDESLGSGGVLIGDDKEGNLYIVGSSPIKYVGDIIYTHGIAVITDLTYVAMMDTTPITNVAYRTSHPIFTHTYQCKIRESEFNHTHNPSAISSSIKTTYDNIGDIYSISASYSDGVRNNNITVEEFQPYITTVGLYNDASQLIAVGKLAQPVPKSANTEMTITVKIDI